MGRLLAIVVLFGGVAFAQEPDLIVLNAQVTTLSEDRPVAQAFAVSDGLFTTVGSNEELRALISPTTRVIDAGGRRVVPGLNDSHCHAVRGGRFYTLELRWDGLDSLSGGLDMIATQAKRTPEGQWVRVVGGWSPYQFVERRMPTIAELNEAAPDTPVFVLYLYSQGFLNEAGVEALGIDETTQSPKGGRYELVDGGAILHASPDPTILYQAIAKLPQLNAEQQEVSTRYFYRELNRFGLTSVIDAGGGGHLFPDDYGGSQALAASGELPMRISYYLFPQRPGKEHEDFTQWTSTYTQGHSADDGHDHGFELEGGGEFLVWSAGDYENFQADRPDLAQRGDWQTELYNVTSLLVEKRWPLRIHATYGPSIALIMDVFERVEHRRGRFAPRWAIDHAETATTAELKRIKALGGGIAIQNRMAFAGEDFVARYGAEAARFAPPVREMLDLGIPVGAGTDSSRVSSYNPWLSLHWLVTGETLGGMELFDDANTLTREEALRLFTIGSAWFSQEETVKGRIAPGQYADFAILSADYFAVPEPEIKRIESVLTVVAGGVVYAAEPFAGRAPVAPLPPIEPAWSPAGAFGGWQGP
jgi:predicted amidohydrolase YtcJ